MTRMSTNHTNTEGNIQSCSFVALVRMRDIRVPLRPPAANCCLHRRSRFSYWDREGGGKTIEEGVEASVICASSTEVCQAPEEMFLCQGSNWGKRA